MHLWTKSRLLRWVQTTYIEKDTSGEKEAMLQTKAILQNQDKYTNSNGRVSVGRP